MNTEIPKSQLRRARITALAMVLSLVFSLLMFVYALIKKSEADRLMDRVNQMNKQLELAKKEAALQQSLAEAERQRAEENYRRAIEMQQEAGSKTVDKKTK